jgi:hypothetical protein
MLMKLRGLCHGWLVLTTVNTDLRRNPAGSFNLAFIHSFDRSIHPDRLTTPSRPVSYLVSELSLKSLLASSDISSPVFK